MQILFLLHFSFAKGLKKPGVMIKFYQQDFQGRQGNSIQRFGNDLSDIQDNLSKIETRVQENANKKTICQESILTF